MMRLRHLLATFLIISTAAYAVTAVSDIEPEKLHWAKAYTVKATRVALISNIEEDFTAWYSAAENFSRVDYNKGAYKVILKNNVTTIAHPETTMQELNELRCHVKYTDDDDDFDDGGEILPETSDFEEVGNELISSVLNEINSTKFVSNYTYYDDISEENTLWSVYSEEFGWIPLKYDEKKYNQVTGTLIKHDVWNFFDYYPDDLDEDVFEPDQIGCNESNTIVHTADSEKITKELHFINPENTKHVDHVFNHFKNKFNRQYKEKREHELRKAIFKENMRLVASVNKRNLTYKLGINKFSDWTLEEKQMLRGVLRRPLDGVTNHATAIPFPYDEFTKKKGKLPKEYDMRALGFVSPVKDQDACGSCWTFAAAAVVESTLAKVTGGNVLGLSNQAIMDCAYDDLGDDGAGGCNGGEDYVAYDFIENFGLPTDQEYGPYKMRDGFCNIDNMTTTYQIKGYTTNFTYYDGDDDDKAQTRMKRALFKYGALYINVNASDEFLAYTSGIFYQSEEQCDPSHSDHSVAMVGYGDIDGEPFFILKNSYGVFWGNDGYMFISARDNVCGVKSSPSYPLLHIRK